MAKDRKWTEEELILALELYIDKSVSQNPRDPHVKELAALLKRTPGAVSYKLGNFKSLDKKRAGGLSHRGGLDRVVWKRFEGDWGRLTAEAEAAAAKIEAASPRAAARVVALVRRRIRDGEYSVPDFLAERKTRMRQAAFRAEILANYGYRCAMCDISIPALLNAGHIRPWGSDKSTRLDPTNGIALCALHDRAFDRGLISVGPTLRIVCADWIGKKDQALADRLRGAGNLTMPVEFPPSAIFLEEHLEKATARWRAGSKGAV